MVGGVDLKFCSLRFEIHPLGPNIIHGVLEKVRMIRDRFATT